MRPFAGAEHYSITHHHLFAVLATEIRKRKLTESRTIRILDVGCGSGSLMGFLYTALSIHFPQIGFELYGIDVSDSRVQPADYFSDTIARLLSSNPEVPWKSRLTLLPSSDDWPHEDDSFDFVVSNQVLEHVRNHLRFFRNVSRVMKREGLSAHIFPLRNCWIEWHLKMPFAHWVTNNDALYSFIRAASLLGLGTWRKYCQEVKPISLDKYVTMNRDFILLETNYLVESEIRLLSKLSGLKYAFRYTEDFYLNRLRLALNCEQKYALSPRHGFLHWLQLLLLKRVSSITLTLEKDNNYINCGLHTPGKQVMKSY